MTFHDKKKLGLILVLISSFGYGTMPAIAQRGFQAGISAETMLAFRYIVSIILIWMYVWYKRIPFKLPVRTILFLLFLGMLMVGGSTFVYESYKYVPGAIVSLLVNLYVVLVVIIEILIGWEKLKISKFGCVALALTGLIIIVWVPEGEVSFHIWGIVFAILTAVCYAFYTIGIGAKGTRQTAPEIVTAYTLIPPGVFNIVRCMVTDQPLLPVGFEQWMVATYIGVISTFVAGLCFIIAVKHIGSGNAALINTTEPMFAYITGIVLMGDIISLRSTFGGVLIVIAIVWLNMISRSPNNIKFQV